MNILLGNTPFTHFALAIVLAVSSLTAHGGKITSNLTDSVGVVQTLEGFQSGFGGLDFSNLEVILDDHPDSVFNTANGEYFFSDASNGSYAADVYNQSTVVGKILAKDWPVGEPAGIKIVNDDPDYKLPTATSGAPIRPSNCIISTSYLEGHFLDAADPKPVLCTSDFQAHKRYKLAMLPASLTADGIDIVFNVEDDSTNRDYQVFQKINNWTGERLTGFTIEVGTGTGSSFVPASAGVGVANLSISAPVTAWDTDDQNANFSQGLFGPVDIKHDRPHGFFDADTRAGFVFNEYGLGNTADASGQIDKLTSGRKLGSSYNDVPAGSSVAANQFGDWIPDTMLPYGIFYDEDDDPATDDLLVAWYGYHPGSDKLAWMTGTDTTEPADPTKNFSLVSDATITEVWGKDRLYRMDFIDDLVNVGLNYIVTVGDIAPNFTIRIKPIADQNPAPAPSYVGVIPTPTLADAYVPPSGGKDGGWTTYMAGTSWLTLGILGLGLLLRRKGNA